VTGKLAAIVILGSALIAGAALYYLQVHAFYDEARLVSEGGEVEMRITLSDGSEIALPTGDFRAIDARSSPIRFRACFRAQLPQDVGLVPYAGAVPLTAPGWFECFDAGRIAADLAAGRARAWLGQANVVYGVDRVLAVYPDGTARAWHQINACGARVFDGHPAPEGCPPAPEGQS